MNTSNRPKKLCLWTDEQMTRAIEAMKTTLKDRITGRVKHGTKPGPVANLDPSELVNFLFECSRMGYGRQREKYYR